MRVLTFLLLSFFLALSLLVANGSKANDTMLNDWGLSHLQDNPSTYYLCPGGKTIQATGLRTQLDVRDFVLCAKSYVERYGLSLARRAFHSDAQWRSDNVYVFVDSYTPDGDKAKSYIYPPDASKQNRIWGKTWDVFGNEYFQEVYRIAQNFGHGWSYYAFENPDTRQPEPKFSYVSHARVAANQNGFRSVDVIIGAGVYPRGTSNDVVYGNCGNNIVSASFLETNPSLKKLQDFVRCASHAYTDSSRGVVDEFSSSSHWRSSSIYLFAINPRPMSNGQVLTRLDALNQGLFTPLGTETQDVMDEVQPIQIFSAKDYNHLSYYFTQLDRQRPEWETPEAGLGHRNVAALALGADESFLYYKAINPATNTLQRKVVFLKRAVDRFEDAEVLIGAGYYLRDDQQAHPLNCSPTPLRHFNRAALVETREDVEAFVRQARCFVENNSLEDVKVAFHEEGQWFHQNEGFQDNSMYLWVEEFDRDFGEEGSPTAGRTDFHNAGVLEVYGHPTDGPEEEGKPWGRELIDTYKNSYYPEAYRMLRQQNAGWIYYSYPNPGARTSDFKSTFVTLAQKDNGKEYMVAAGLWDRGVPGACEPGDINAEQIDHAQPPTPRMLQDLVRCAILQIRPSGSDTVRPQGTASIFDLLPRSDPNDRPTRWISKSGSVYMSIFTSNGFPFATTTSPNWHQEWPVTYPGPNPDTRIFPLLNSLGGLFLHYSTQDPGSNGRTRKKLMYIQRLPITNNYVGAGYFVD